jgi:hypothetical protein
MRIVREVIQFCSIGFLFFPLYFLFSNPIFGTYFKNLKNTQIDSSQTTGKKVF